MNSTINSNQCSHNDVMDTISTGFDKNNELHYKVFCKKSPFNIPLYKDNYLSEFETEEEKAAARHSLGLYNKKDVITMGLLTAEDDVPTKQQWNNPIIKQLQRGSKFFVPCTSFDAVFDSQGNNLQNRLNEILQTISKQQDSLNSVTSVSNKEQITSLGDIIKFLHGFKNGENLSNIINDYYKDQIKFESVGFISNS